MDGLRPFHCPKKDVHTGDPCLALVHTPTSVVDRKKLEYILVVCNKVPMFPKKLRFQQKFEYVLVVSIAVWMNHDGSIVFTCL
jgi:hypothetical protein